MKPIANFQDQICGITTIDTAFTRPEFAASHLIVEADRAAFVDVGTSYSTPHLLATLAAKNIPVENVDYVIVTHVHLDHAGGAGTLMQALPNAKLVVHPRGARHMIDPSQLIAGASAVYGEEQVKKDYGDILPIDEKRVISAADGFTLSLNSRQFTFLDTPGHAKHHFCVFDERSRGFFTGDTFGISYRVFDTAKGQFIFATTSPSQFEPLAMHNSIERMMQYQPEAMFLTHYGMLQNVSQMADKLHDNIDQQILFAEEFAEAGEERHQLLTDALMQYFILEVRALGCTLSDADCRSWLKTDVELNAQGMEIWWDKGN